MTDYTVADTIYLMFTTRAFATGIPTTLAGTPVVSAYENDSATQITAGITLGVDHDSVTGLNLLTIVATGANGYESGKDYNMVITTGTVDSVSVVGEVVGTFSLGRSAAAVDLANGTDGLGAIKTDTAAILADTGTDGVVVASINANAVTAGAIASNAITSAKIAASAIGASQIASNAITAAKIATDAITAAKIAADAIGSSELATTAVNEIVDQVWDEAQADHTSAGSFGEVATEIGSVLADTDELQGDWANGGRLDLILDARASQTTADAIETDTQDIQSRLPAALVGGRIDATVDGTGMESGAVSNILTTQMTEAYAADGTAPTLAQALFMIMQQAGEFSISGTTITVKKLDGSTTAATFTLDDGTNPTSRTRAS